MAIPEHADYVIIGAGIHGLSTSWRLAQRLIDQGERLKTESLFLISLELLQEPQESPVG